MDPEEAPPELSDLLKEVDRQKKGGAPNTQMKQTDGEDITPETGFVVKTSDDAGRKWFINICGCSKIPAPGNWDKGKIPEKAAKALEELEEQEGEPADALRFPLSCGDMRNDLDKRGDPCSVVDVVLNADVVTQCLTLRRLKVFIVELAMAWVGQKNQTELDPKYKLPHLKYKGKSGPVAQRIRVDPKCLIHELDEPEDEEPSFPLRTRPLVQTAALPPEGLRRAAAAAAASMDLPPPPPASSPSTSFSTSTSASAPTPTTSSSFAFQSSHPTAYSSPSTTGTGQELGDGVSSFSGARKEALGRLSSRVEFQGLPVSEMTVKVHLPAGVKPCDMEVAVVHEGVEVAVKGFSPLHVHLPLLVSAETARTKLETYSDGSPSLLIVHLLYRPIREVLEEARLNAPHTFGALGLSNTAIMDLD